jgi:succinate dehydrogenase/fumarate reductase flavoprotein subunit
LKKRVIASKGNYYTVYSMNTVVVGSGAAGFNAADRLYSFGQEDIALVTEGMNKGTSRNTGSDKQTYYKLTLSGNQLDSVQEVAESLFGGGSMDGDLALVEAAMSPWCFYHLVDIGVPFPHNRYGEYVGYQTDHDLRMRATSAGPLTSKIMAEKLEAEVRRKKIRIFDRQQVIGILTEQGRAVGLLALDLNSLEDKTQRYVIFNATNIVYAAGGPAGMYRSSVYPVSQTGATGIALEAGAAGKNVTESQYGLASIKFRWNLSGTYQQVLPRYVSINKDGGDEQEFLRGYFETPGQMLDAIFLKGYQWPFDPRKVLEHGSSLIDILVYNETVIKRRKVFLDYTKNPQWGSLPNGELDFSLLGEEAYSYLQKSGALWGKPVERLRKMNGPAIELYKEHKINLCEEYLEIAVCAQHNNGGLYGDLWWESNLKHLFPVGEVNGTHGVYRPGGSALNSGQVGSTRAAQYIARQYREAPMNEERILSVCGEQIADKIALGAAFLGNMSLEDNVWEIRREIGKRMSACGAHIRVPAQIKKALEETKEMLGCLSTKTKLSTPAQLPYAFQNYDLLLTQAVYLSAMLDYMEQGGKSRGSYLIYDPAGELPVPGLADMFQFKIDTGALLDKIQIAYFDREKKDCQFSWRKVIPVPQQENWFETIWDAYRAGGIIK